MNPPSLLALGSRKISKDCDIRRHKLVAIAMSKSGHIIASATNRKASGRVSDFSFHAEEFLVRKLRKLSARERYGPIRVFVARLARSGWALAKPCDKCHSILTSYGIDDIWYTDKLNIVKL